MPDAEVGGAGSVHPVGELTGQRYVEVLVVLVTGCRADCRSLRAARRTVKPPRIVATSPPVVSVTL